MEICRPKGRISVKSIEPSHCSSVPGNKTVMVLAYSHLSRMHPRKPLQDSTLKICANRGSTLRSEPMCSNQSSVFKSFAIAPCAKGRMKQLQLQREVSKLHPSKLLIWSWSLLASALSGLFQAQLCCSSFNSSTGTLCSSSMYLHLMWDWQDDLSESYLSNTPLASILKECWC